MTMNESDDDRALANLLPFYATGKLSLTDMQRIERALASDDGLRRELELVEEEQAATVEANEMLGLPSARSADRFFAMLEAEPARTTPRALAKGVFAWIGERLQSFAPRQMAFAGIAAAMLLVFQAGYIGVLLQRSGGTDDGFRTAFGNEVNEGTFAEVTFQPEAKSSDISHFFLSVRARIVEGPRAGDIYRVRIGKKDMSKPDRDAAIARLRAEKNVVRTADPSI
jgi:anti-sigma factor RsiW